MLTSMKFKKTTVLLFCFLFNIVSLFAHPHMFLNSKLEFFWEGSELKKCRVTWDFDKFFSSDIISAYDYDRDGVFNEEENWAVYYNAFINLKNYYYFFFIRDGKERFTPEEVSDFKASYKDGTLRYSFAVDIPEIKGETVAIAVYDYTFFCDIAYDEENPVVFYYDGAKVKPEYKIAKNKNYPVYYNPLGAIDDTTVYYEWKKGLETFYPSEILVKY